MKLLQCGRFELDLSTPRIMAIINLTADSFSGDGLQGDVAAALRCGEQALEDGADILDVGAESSRPGATAVPAVEECERVLRFVEQARSWNVPLSIDTVKPVVMRAALEAGADMINDICGFRHAESVAAVADSTAALCVMHMQGVPGTMQNNPSYENVVAEVKAYLYEQAAMLEAAGVARTRLLLDPGFGFGKRVEHNFTLLREFGQLVAGGLPLLAGLSRKSMLGAVTGRAVDARLGSSVAAALIAVQRGAAVVRVHDVAATRDALSVWQAVQP